MKAHSVLLAIYYEPVWKATLLEGTQQTQGHDSSSPPLSPNSQPELCSCHPTPLPKQLFLQGLAFPVGNN